MLAIGGRNFDPDLVIFDKDGTLIDFEHLWHAWFKRLFTTLGERIALGEAVRLAIAQTLGYDPISDRWDPEGALTLAPISEIKTLLAGLLFRYNHLTWSCAVALVAAVESDVRLGLPLSDLVRPVGDVRALLSRLRQAGIKLAVATGDIRQITMESLRIARIDDMFEVVLCADDGVPTKPAPDAVLAICTRLHIAPERAIMVGDSVEDLMMARAAGMLAGVGVTGGASPVATLAPYADILIPDIQSISVIPNTRG